MSTTRKVYMIRRKTDGLFSTGGSYPDFSKKGKVWSTLGALKNHLNLALIEPIRYYGKHRVTVYDDCEIIAMEQVVTETPIDIADFITEYREKSKKYSGID